MILGRGRGSTSARIMIVGEAWGQHEEEQREPFVGLSGMELSKMLAEVGIARSECYLTNVVNARPPHNDLTLWLDSRKKKSAENGLFHSRDGYFYNDIIAAGLVVLEADLAAIKPTIVIVLGNAALWAFMGKDAITSWRGSILWSERYAVKVCPTLHPAYILRVWEERHLVLHDLKRFLPELAYPEIRLPDYKFEIRPSDITTIARLKWLLAQCDVSPFRIAVDIETRAGHIACIGFAWSRLEALCIPLMCTENPLGYWPLEKEVEIVLLIRDLLLHPNARIIGQGFLYDAQYLAKFWGFVPAMHMDTMIVHHICYLGMAKALDFLSSLYCSFHQYWKDEGKEWTLDTPEEQLWTYNCKDAVTTWEVSVELEETVVMLDQRQPVDFTMSLFQPVLRMMLRGVRFDEQLGSTLSMEILDHIATREQLIIDIAGRLLNPNSPKQLIQYFYFELGLPKQYHPQRKNLTTDDEALKKLANIEPLVRKLCYAILEIRSLKNSLSVINRKRDSDGRVRCSYNIAGTDTTRFSSSENAFGNGMNLQNITSGGKSSETGLVLPNLRRLLIPEAQRIWVDIDLARADLQVVTWEADDQAMKDALKRGMDMHLFSVRDIFNIDIPDDEIIETHPKWAEHKERYKSERHDCKAGVHATNYFCQPRKLSSVLGTTVHRAQQFQERWFGAHPGVKKWHERIHLQLQTTRQVRNAFGFRRLFLGRIDDSFTKGLAWIPQSTVARVINGILIALDKHVPEIDLLLQVHDSLDFQLSYNTYTTILEKAKPHFSITVPYPDPLIIPVGFAVSTRSWGDCK
jgi:DNA polymerase I-like protein with 3'-5' exonuclease and polymerase domains/uracil-DNA glycosylase